MKTCAYISDIPHETVRNVFSRFRDSVLDRVGALHAATGVARGGTTHTRISSRPSEAFDDDGHTRVPGTHYSIQMTFGLYGEPAPDCWACYQGYGEPGLYFTAEIEARDSDGKLRSPYNGSHVISFGGGKDRDFRFHFSTNSASSGPSLTEYVAAAGRITDLGRDLGFAKLLREAGVK